MKHLLPMRGGYAPRIVGCGMQLPKPSEEQLFARRGQ